MNVTNETNAAGEKPRPLDPQIAYRLDARRLLALVPGFNQQHLRELSQAFARHIAGQGRFTPITKTWEQAWDAFANIGPNGKGRLDLQLHSCPDCSHGATTRNMSANISRMGNPMICASCRGTGRGQIIHISALRATPPTSTQNA